MANGIKWDLASLVSQVESVCEITPDGCWLWRYGVWADRGIADEQSAYPRLMLGGVRKHVAYWVLTASGQPQPPGSEPCHSCDRPPCVAPHHLCWGTHQENMQEMWRRGRSGPTRHPESRIWPADHPFRLHPELISRGPRPGNYASGDNHWTRRMPEHISNRGTSHTMARLAPEIVREIRERDRAGEGATSIARGLGVGRTTVRAVIEGRTWGHIA
jgi:hypothetical protein